jgi:hypothetical protein
METDARSIEKWLEINVKMVLDSVILIRGKLSRLQRKILAALITTDVFCKDQIDLFVQEKVHKKFLLILSDIIYTFDDTYICFQYRLLLVQYFRSSGSMTLHGSSSCGTTGWRRSTGRTPTVAV